jgi:hypothetical protein
MKALISNKNTDLLKKVILLKKGTLINNILFIQNHEKGEFQCLKIDEHLISINEFDTFTDVQFTTSLWSDFIHNEWKNLKIEHTGLGEKVKAKKFLESNSNTDILKKYYCPYNDNGYTPHLVIIDIEKDTLIIKMIYEVFDNSEFVNECDVTATVHFLRNFILIQ